MGYAILTATLLLLMQHGSEAQLVVSSNSSGNVLTGKNISLDLQYNIQIPNDTVVSWTVNGVTLVNWIKGRPPTPPASYAGRLYIIGNGSLLISNATKNDSGTYTVTVSAPGEKQAVLPFQVRIYDAVVNATATGSPPLVDEKMPVVVNVTCTASGDIELVTWTKAGQPIAYNDTYSLLVGNKTLQIKNPNRTHAGNYTCNMSNPVSWDDASWELIVTYTDGPAALSGGAIAGIVIGSVVGALLLIALIVLLVICIRKRNNRNEKKMAEPQHKDVLRTISGNTLSPDDPAYFTMNNIMYRSSSISMGSYIMNYNDNMSEYNSSSLKPPSSPVRVKHATQV